MNIYIYTHTHTYCDVDNIDVVGILAKIMELESIYVHIAFPQRDLKHEVYVSNSVLKNWVRRKLYAN